MDFVMRLLEKDPRRRMSVKDACEYAWVLVEDGDTHLHLLHNPVARKQLNKEVEGGSVCVIRAEQYCEIHSEWQRQSDI